MAQTTTERAFSPDEDEQIVRADDGTPVGVVPRQRWTPARVALWVAVSR